MPEKMKVTHFLAEMRAGLSFSPLGLQASCLVPPPSVAGLNFGGQVSCVAGGWAAPTSNSFSCTRLLLASVSPCQRQRDAAPAFKELIVLKDLQMAPSPTVDLMSQGSTFRE